MKLVATQWLRPRFVFSLSGQGRLAPFVNGSKERRLIAYQAARLMHSREVSEYFQAKMKAARRIGLRRPKPGDLPSNAEVREQILSLTRMLDPPSGTDRLCEMRVRALWWMRQLDDFHPKIIGSVLTGDIRDGSDIDLHLFTNHIGRVVDVVECLGFVGELDRKRVTKDGETRIYNHVRVRDRDPIELTVYPLGEQTRRFRSSITGKVIESAGGESLQRLIEFDHSFTPVQVEQQIACLEGQPNRWSVYASLLLPLESVIGCRQYHPEGDTLYHSLQVYDLAKNRHAYDEEFLLAALLHDVGKGIDPGDHVAAGLEALDGFISDRTAWLIRYHMDAHAVADRSIGHRAGKRLRAHPWFDDLMILSQCDRRGRRIGVQTSSLEQALDEIESITERFG